MRTGRCTSSDLLLTWPACKTENGETGPEVMAEYALSFSYNLCEGQPGLAGHLPDRFLRNNKMRCRDVKSNLPVYSDDILTEAERTELDSHLDTCPLCRQALSEFQEIRNDLRSLWRPALSEQRMELIRSTVSLQLAPAGPSPVFHVIEDRRSWYKAWLMPSAVGTLASIIFGVLLIWSILLTARNPDEFVSKAPASTSRPSSMILTSDNAVIGPEILELSPSEYASTRLSIADESPSVNPRGALIALTKSLVRGEMRDDEVVVVAEVFGNGLAKIAEVVEPSNNDKAVRQLQQALESDPAYAPFVPASYDRRSETMRVVLKFQNVNVKTTYTAPRPKVPERRRS